jgi:hypothetical protein
MRTAELDVLVRDIQADAKQVRLLDLLGRQLEILINEGKPDLDCFLVSLKAEALVSEEDWQELKSTFALDCVCRPHTP